MQCHIYFEQTRNAKIKQEKQRRINKQFGWDHPARQTIKRRLANQHGLSPFFPLAMLDERPLYQQTNKQTLFLEEFYTLRLQVITWWWRGVGSHGDDEHITNGSGVKKREKRAAEGAIRTKGNQTRAIVREGMERGKNGTLSQILRPTNPTRYWGTPKE